MTLTVMERLLLLSCLPAESNILTLKIVQKLRADLGFDESEHALYQLRDMGDGKIEWNPDVPQEKEIPIGEKATDIIVKSLKAMDAKEKLTEAHIPLWEKFIGE